MQQGEGAPTAAARVEEKRAREEQDKEEREGEEEAQPQEEKRLKEEPGPAEEAQPKGDADGWDAEAVRAIARGMFGTSTPLGSGPAPGPSSAPAQPLFGTSGAPAAAPQQSQQQQQEQEQPQGSSANVAQSAVASTPPAFGAAASAPSFGAAAAAPTFGAAAGPAFGAAAGPAFGAAAASAQPVFGYGAAASPGGAIGFRTGGAQDVRNFRANVKSGYLPLSSDVSFEGLCKDYYFSMEPAADREGEGRSSGNEGEEEQEAQERCTDLFYPTYSLALAPDPVLAAATLASAAGPADATAAAPSAAQELAATGAAAPATEVGAASGAADTDAAPGPATAGAPQPPPDLFLSVGLGSGLEEFKRPRLNLVVLLDISGSMSAPFDAYFYDAVTGKRQELSPTDKWRTKMGVAKECLLGVLDLLHEDDSVSVVLFNNRACVPKRMGPVRTARLDEIRAGIEALSSSGGTNLQLGIETAAAQLREYSGFQKADPVTTESRILLLTDAEPNLGLCSGEGLARHLKACALDGIHATCVGVGLDFNSDLVEQIFKIKGANYFSVHSPGEFKQRLCDQFDMAVSPLVFDLSLRVEAASLQSGWRILDVYGSPNTEDAVLADDGVALMKVHTLFPSPKTEAGVKGGVLLLKLAPPEPLAATTDSGANARAAQAGPGGEEVAGAAQPAADEGSSTAAEQPAPAEGGAGTVQPAAPLGLKVQYRDRAGRIFTSAAEVALPAGWLAAGAGSGGWSGGSSLQEAEGAAGGSGMAETAGGDGERMEEGGSGGGQAEGAGGSGAAEVGGNGKEAAATAGSGAAEAAGGSGTAEAGSSGGGLAGAEGAEAGEGEDEGDTVAAVQQQQEGPQQQEEGQQEQRQEQQEERQPSGLTSCFQSTGVRKAVALVRYVEALQSWLKEEWDAQSQPSPSQPPSTPQEQTRWAAFGPPHPSQGHSLFGQPPSSWPTFGGGFTLFGGGGGGMSSQERQSRKLSVGPAAQARFAALLPFMRREAEEVDPELQQEVEVLERLIQVADESSAGVDDSTAVAPASSGPMPGGAAGRVFRPTPLNDDRELREMRMHHISAMPENVSLSPEELRLEAYQEPSRGLWPPSSSPVFPPPAAAVPPAHQTIPSWPPSAATNPHAPPATFPPFVPPAPPAARSSFGANSTNIEISGDVEELEIVVHPEGSVDVKVRDRASGFPFGGQHHFLPPGSHVRVRFRPSPGSASGPSQQLFGQAGGPLQAPQFGAAGTGAGSAAQHASAAGFSFGNTGSGFGSGSSSPGIPAFWGASAPAFGSGSGGGLAVASSEAPGRAGFGLPSSFAALGLDGAATVAPVFGGSGGGSGSFGGSGFGSFGSGSAAPATSCRPDPRQPASGPSAVSAPAFGGGSAGAGALSSSPPQGLFGSGPTSAAAPAFGSTSSTAPGFGSSSAAGLFGSQPASSAGFGFGVPSTMPPMFGSLGASAAASGFGSVVSSPAKSSG